MGASQLHRTDPMPFTATVFTKKHFSAFHEGNVGSGPPWDCSLVFTSLAFFSVF